MFLCTREKSPATAWDAPPPTVALCQRPYGLFLCPPQCYTRLHHPRDCHPTPDRRGNPVHWCRDLGVLVCPPLCPRRQHLWKS
jgi:hypothetical protein